MVAPERETPGISATHCHSPITSASLIPIVASSRGEGLASALRSASQRTIDQTMRAPATTHSDRRAPVMRGLATSAMTTMGMTPTITPQPSL